MPFQKRTQFLAFVENQEEIESGWDAIFGDRKNEIVLIGQNMDQEQIKSELDACIATEPELNSEKWIRGYHDEWPVERAYVLE